MTFVLLKNGSPMTRLVPGDEKTCTGHDLAAVLETVELPPAKTSTWLSDFQVARKTLKTPADKWP